MKKSFGFQIDLLLLSLILFFLAGCEESMNSYGEEKDILTIGTTSDTIIVVDSILEYTTIQMKDSIIYRDSMFIVESTYHIDTLVIMTVDSVLKRDTVSVDQFDTLYSVDTLYIQNDDFIDTLYVLDTTDRIHDTVFIHEARKKVYTVAVNVEDRIGYFKISGEYCGGAIPEILGGNRKFEIQNGRLYFQESIAKYDYSTVFYYTIVDKKDTLYGSIKLSDYLPDSIFVNGVAYGDFNREDNRWDIEHDFDTSLTISIPENDNVTFSMYASSSTDDWLNWHWYFEEDVVLVDSTPLSYHYDVPDPVTHDVHGSIQFKTRVAGGTKPDNESKIMEAYHLVTLPDQNYEIARPDTAFDVIKAIGRGGWTSFKDDNSSLIINADNYSANISKEGSGYGIAHGAIGQEGMENSLRKMKKLFVRYIVQDSSDTLSIRLTSGVKTTIDEKSWNYFHTVLTSGANEPGEMVIDILDLDDFKISWGDSRFPSGTTLADDIAQEYLASCDGIAITQEGDGASNSTFDIYISEMFIIGEYGIYEEAHLEGISE